MTPEERLTRIEANMERLEVWIEKALYQHDSRIQRLAEFQAVLMESQNDTWRALKTLSDNIEKLIQLRGPNGQG